MKRIFLLVIFLLISFGFKSQIGEDVVTLSHTNYSSIYSKDLHYPLLVEWWETTAKVTCPNQLPRKDQFGPDPYLKIETNLQKDYDLANKIHKEKGLKGFDRGHMCPAASNECSGNEILTECFYFSNMAPQYHSLNAGDWKTLETLTREIAIKEDSVNVWAGSIGVAEKIGSLSIPTKCWKVIHVLKTNEFQSYIFENTPHKPTGLQSHKVKVEDVEKLTGFKFE